MRVVLEGYVGEDCDGLILKDKKDGYSGMELPLLLEEELSKQNIIIKKHCECEGYDLEEVLEEEEDFHYVTYLIENCTIQMYNSPEKISLEDAQLNSLNNILGGDLSCFGREYGYSAWTIMGFNTELFKIGNHNLLKILESHKGEYIHMVIEFEEEK